jgi:soluble lytic murein transglycosylase-like protein
MSLATVLQRVDRLQGLVAGPALQGVPATASTGAPRPVAPTTSTTEPFSALLAREVGTPVPSSTAAHPYATEIDDAARRHGIAPALIRSVMRQESSFDPRATSHAGAQGLMQLMPATARSLGVTDPYDPVQSIEGGTRYLADMLERFEGNVPLALAAYNAGPSAVDRFGGIPPYRETQDYVEKVLDGYRTPNDERSVP